MECKWLGKEEFEEIAAEATTRMKNRRQKPARELCIYETRFCTECNRCHGEEEL